jgi:hypothetical protein
MPIKSLFSLPDSPDFISPSEPSPDSTTDTSTFSSSSTDFTLSEISLPSIAEGPLSIFLFFIELSVCFSASSFLLLREWLTKLELSERPDFWG